MGDIHCNYAGSGRSPLCWLEQAEAVVGDVVIFPNLDADGDEVSLTFDVVGAKAGFAPQMP